MNLMKHLLISILAISFSAGSVNAWGSGDCKFSNKGEQKEVSKEEVKKSEPRKQN